VQDNATVDLVNRSLSPFQASPSGGSQSTTFCTVCGFALSSFYHQAEASKKKGFLPQLDEFYFTTADKKRICFTND
jgi:hypothetical protein